MADGHEHLSHLLVQIVRLTRSSGGRGGPNPRVRPVEDRAGHGGGRLSELQSAFSSGDETREEQLTEDELRALGTIVTLEGDDPAYPLKLDTLQQLTSHQDPRRKRPKWLLLSVLPADQKAVPPSAPRCGSATSTAAKFLQLFEDFLAKESPTGKPRNNELVANIARIRSTILLDLWQSAGTPPEDENVLVGGLAAPKRRRS